MKPKFVILSIFSVLCVSSFAAPAKGGKLVTTQDSLSYAVGINMAQSIDNNGKYQFDSNLVIKGMSDYFSKKQIIEPDDAESLLRDYFSVRLPAEAKAEAATYGDTVGRNNPYIKETESGLLYQIVDSGDSDFTVTDDTQTVMVHYDIVLRDGTVVDSSREQGEPTEFMVGNVVEGFAQGLKLIGRGGQIKLWIPPALAYGEDGSGQEIGPYQWLIVDVELIDILDEEEEDQNVEEYEVEQ